jgi:hypothetical protein
MVGGTQSRRFIFNPFNLKEKIMTAIQSNRAPKTYKPGAWTNSDGEFGLAIADDSNEWDQHNRVNPYVMTIEMTPDDMIELAKDLIVVALQKKGIQDA